MIPLNLWEHQNIIKTFYGKCVEGVCEKHQITRMELDILLFLSNNPLFDTAADIVEVRCLSKSQVSVSIKLLEEKGYLKKKYTKENRKTAHLQVCDLAVPIILDGKAAQEQFVTTMFAGIPQKEMEVMKQCHQHILENIKRYQKEGFDFV